MLTKTIAILTILAALVAARAVTVSPHKSETPTPTVTVSDEGSYPADEQADCEYVVTPKTMKVIKGGEGC